MSFLDENITTSVTPTDAALVALGQRGCACASDSSVPLDNYATIQCLTDCTFDVLDTVYGSASSSPFVDLCNSGFVFPAGTIFYGPFKYISATSGTYIAYKA